MCVGKALDLEIQNRRSSPRSAVDNLGTATSLVFSSLKWNVDNSGIRERANVLRTYPNFRQINKC